MHLSIRYCGLARARALLRNFSLLLAVAALTAGCHDNSTPATSGLVPPAPAPGEVLYTQAADLRPLRDGAAWSHRGHDLTAGTVYETLVQQRREGDNGAVIETRSRDVTSGRSLSVSLTGDVLQRGVLLLPWGGTPLPIEAIELPSPLRQDAQWTIFDRQLADIGTDIDGDGIRDSASVGIYSQVIGNETVPLPDHAPMAALRVDTHVVLLLHLSGGGASAATEQRVSTWYAPGIGPVRRAVGSGAVGREFDQDESLVRWDGISEGLGYLAQGLVFQAGSGALTGTPLPPQRLSLALPDGALVLTAAGEGYAVHRLDRRGTLVSTHLYPASASLANAFQWLRLSAGPRLLSRSAGGIDLWAYSDDGLQIGDAPAARLTGPYAAVAAADGGDSLWAAWTTSDPPYDQGGFTRTQSHVLAQRFAANGQALTTALDLGSTLSTAACCARYPILGSMVATSSAMVLAWSTSLHLEDFVSMAANDGSVLQRQAAFPLQGSFPLAVADNSDQWLVWACTYVGRRPCGARLGADGAYVLDSGGDLAAQQIEALGEDPAAGWPAAYAALEGHLVGIDWTRGGMFWPEDAQTADWITLRDLDASAPVLASGARLVAQVRVPAAGLFSSVTAPALLWPDRALLLAEKDGHLQTIVVWRR